MRSYVPDFDFEVAVLGAGNILFIVPAIEFE